jgi:hypothetical protein
MDLVQIHRGNHQVKPHGVSQEMTSYTTSRDNSCQNSVWYMKGNFHDVSGIDNPSGAQFYCRNKNLDQKGLVNINGIFISVYIE